MAVVRREGINDAIREARGKVVQSWHPFGSLKRFISHHRPEDWREIQSCRMHYRVYESVERPGFYKVAPYVCKRIPWCITCVQYERWRRVKAALDKFYLCTPAGQEPRFVHVVQTAPTGEGAWGEAAAQDVPAFARVVWDSLKGLYGDGIGAVMSYHDFGERGFAKVHPHMDLTLNGWMVADGAGVKTATFDLTGKGLERWNEVLVSHARRLHPDARRGNVNLTRPISGAEAYFKILKYQMRELVDVRKIQYDRDGGNVYWCSYRETTREKFSVADFLRGFDEYQSRLGLYGSGSREGLHRSYGHMSKRSLRATARLLGGQLPPHGARCPCSQCGDWDRAFPDDVDRYQGPGLQVRS